MKLDDVLALIKPHLATDAKLDALKIEIMAADKGAKDKAKDEFPDKDAEKKAKDRKSAHDKARDSMSAKDKAAFDAMSDEEKDKVACDKDGDPEGTNDEEVDAEDNDLTDTESGTPSKGGANKKPAMDEATVQRIVADAVGARDELHTAAREVEAIVGRRTFDNAGDAYKAGLEALGVDLTGVPPAAFPAMLKLARDRAVPAAPIAMDAAGAAEVVKLIPNYNRL